MAGVVQHAGRNARQLGHLHAVAAAGRAGLDFVQKDDVVAIFSGGHVHVDGGAGLGGQLGQLKVMRGKQGKSLHLVVQVAGNAAGQGQPVKGGGAPANLVHQHQAVRGGTVQNLRRLGHLQHKGRLRVGQIIGRANAGVDGINRPQAAGAGRHVAAHAGQQHDQRHLAHVSRFTAHVRPGNDVQALARVQIGAVGDEGGVGRLRQPLFHHRVAALVNLNARLGRKTGRTPVQGE